MNSQLVPNAGTLLTTGSILKIWMIEFFMCELIIILFVVLKPSTNAFTMSIGKGIVASSGDKLTDFIVLSIFVCLLTAFTSILLWAGQTVLSWIAPLTFRLR
ncbi:hypothetical protein DUT91_23795 [Phyllobacterium salinisoli]|uniref:Uncharacterized protein n=1 Tax=Phyllobacterium salinisoli TaxID=1899321 RepID=A0A368JWF0_9HYPH|nr:hypothetical protein [Phyllobacterium salinisoli]RCS21498.1 hypothetical protein DUT91_23795 [Phyllobacterium salinisoli]